MLQSAKVTAEPAGSDRIRAAACRRGMGRRQVKPRQVTRNVLGKIGKNVILCALLFSSLLAEAALPQGQPPQATMNISGAVTVNGKPATQPAAIFSGDVIQTGPASFATIVSDNLEITVPENSSLTFNPGAINLGCGSSSVFTKAGQTILHTQGGATITPTSPDGFNKIEVSQGGGTTVIHVVLGSVSVGQGGQSTAVQAGSHLDLPGSPCTAPVPTPLTSSNGGAAPAGQASGASNAWVPIVIGAGGGGALAAILLSRRNNNQPVSPTQP